MPTLSELNYLQSQINSTERRVEDARHRSERLAGIRKGDGKLTDFVTGKAHVYPSDLKDLILGVIDEFSADLLRVLEMRQDAIAREASAKARQLKVALAAVVDPEPEKDPQP